MGDYKDSDLLRMFYDSRQAFRTDAGKDECHESHVYDVTVVLVVDPYLRAGFCTWLDVYPEMTETERTARFKFILKTMFPAWNKYNKNIWNRIRKMRFYFLFVSIDVYQ